MIMLPTFGDYAINIDNWKSDASHKVGANSLKIWFEVSVKMLLLLA